MPAGSPVVREDDRRQRERSQPDLLYFDRNQQLSAKVSAITELNRVRQGGRKVLDRR